VHKVVSDKQESERLVSNGPSTQTFFALCSFVCLIFFFVVEVAIGRFKVITFAVILHTHKPTIFTGWPRKKKDENRKKENEKAP